MRAEMIDLSRFFGSRRCRKLREITLDRCAVDEKSSRTLAINAADTLRSIRCTFLHSPGESDAQDCRRYWPVVSILLATCHHVEALELSGPSDSALAEIGRESRAPLRVVKMWGLSETPFSDVGLRAMIPAISQATDISIFNWNVSRDCVLEAIQNCTYLRRLRLSLKLLGAISPDILPYSIVLTNN
jgi:hypothetical protein